MWIYGLRHNFGIKLKISMIKAIKLEKILELKSKQLTILNNVTLDTNNSKVNILFGKSGSGKTTLLHILSGLDLPSNGECWIDGIDMTKLSTDDRAAFRLKKIGMVYQFFNLIPNLTLIENIQLPLIISNRKNNEIKDICEYLGITNILNQFPAECSGGELQRASFARALINNPKVIMADEPTGNLDSKNRQLIMDLIVQCTKDFDVTFFIATHDDLFKSIATKQFLLKDGELTN